MSDRRRRAGGSRTGPRKKTVRASLGKGKEALEEAILQTYQLKEVHILQTVAVPKQEAGEKKKVDSGEVVMGAAVKG